jgi:putative copper export protein
VNWLGEVVLWTHVVSASWWVLACTTMALVGAVLSTESAEGREFVVRVVPKFNRANVAAAAALLLTGMVNIYDIGKRRGFEFSRPFVHVLAIKVVLFAMMLAALRASLTQERGLIENPGPGGPGLGRLAGLSGAVALMGAAAMLLGVWLAGS